MSTRPRSQAGPPMTLGNMRANGVRSLDVCCWVCGCVTQIPDVVIPAGTPEGARLWQTYLDTCAEGGHLEDGPHTVVRVDPDTGDVTLAEGSQTIVSPTEK